MGNTSWHAMAPQVARARDEYERRSRTGLGKRRIEEACAKAGFTVERFAETDVALNTIADALEALWNQPRLGVATTRQLLEELAARGRDEQMGSLGKDSGRKEHGINMEQKSQALLSRLPDSILNYRTVDSS